MDHLIRKIDPNKILADCIQYAIDSNIFYYDSMESYYSGKEPTVKRKIHFYFTFTFLVIFNMKYGLLVFYPDKLMLTPMKDITMLFGNMALPLHVLLFALSLVTISGKVIMVYYESQSKLKVYDLIVNFKAGLPLYRLNQNHLKTIKVRAFILYYGYIRILGILLLTIFSMLVITMTIATYLVCDYGNVIILFFWSFLLTFAINQMRIVILIGTFLFYTPITLMNFKFDELLEKFRVSIRWNNENRLHEILRNYNDLIKDIEQLSGPYNMIIGLVYCFVPYLIAINVELIKINRNDILFKITKQLMLFLFIVANVNAFMINQLSASITVRNKSIHKYLYPMFCNHRNRKLQIKLKIDSFIARLNSQFIGFYCFNLFKFTKMAFYQYALTISTCYFLIINFLKK